MQSVKITVEQQAKPFLPTEIFLTIEEKLLV
jgi:hypothetical protein